MAPKLYMTLASPPSRAVIFCAKILGVELDLIDVKIFEGEQFKPEYLKLNPQHTVPVLDDDGFIFWDSHAIMPYLISKYNKGHSLYPEDIKRRAIVDQRMHFDSGTLFAANLKIAFAAWTDKIKKITEEYSEPVIRAFNLLEIFLQDTIYVAGNHLTIADLSIWTTISSITTYLPVDEKKYPKITSWLKLMDNSPFSEMNRQGSEIVRAMFQSKLTTK